MNRIVLLVGFTLLHALNNVLAFEPPQFSHSKIVDIDSAFVSTELLGRPTDQSITINAHARNDLDVYFEYGTESSNYKKRTDTRRFQGGESINVMIDSLAPNCRYYYRMRYRRSGASEFELGQAHTFHTQRPRGSAFTFAVEADPHLDEQSNPEIYRRTLQNILTDNPDFLIDLGDNFMSDKIPEINPGSLITYHTIVNRHLLFRGYYDSICHSVPLFLVIGNHEGECGWELDGSAENMAVWATQARKLFYPNPRPNAFYSGNEDSVKFVGQRENYYAWEWGDALFVVLDPYWCTTIKPGRTNDNWSWTLGEKQYRWFEHTFETSHAAFKFVFCHQVIGGKDAEGRGGAEYVQFYEMGGLNQDGSWGFDEKRPGWSKPIHQLMAQNKVTIFFHGHDHFFARQELDGIVYQLVPQPSHPNYKNAGQAEEYGYITGDILPNSGHLRVNVSASQVTVDYVRAYLPQDENENKGRINGIVDYSYVIPSINTAAPSAKLGHVSHNDFSLKQNYPNPFNSSTTIEYTVQPTANVQLHIYDITGRHVSTLVDEWQNAGQYRVVFSPEQHDNRFLPSGYYFYKMNVVDDTKIMRLLYLK